MSKDFVILMLSKKEALDLTNILSDYISACSVAKSCCSKCSTCCFSVTLLERLENRLKELE